MIPESIKHDLQELEHPILFGSRSMAARSAVEGFDPAIMIGSQITERTDWDFSAQYSEMNQDALARAGFSYWPSGASPYADNLTIRVFSKEYSSKLDWSLSSIFSAPPKVHVVLHSDEELFRRVWAGISPKFYYKYLWKRSPQYDHIDSKGERKRLIREIMNQLYEVAA
jgi:hypothetical protein